MVYYKLMLNALQSTTAYRFHTFVTTLNRLIGLVVQLSLWTALYVGADSLGMTIEQASVQEMWMYAIYSGTIAMVVFNSNIYGLSDSIQSGRIVTTLIRPIGLFRSMLFETLGSKAFVLLFEALPVLALSHLILGLPLPDAASAAAFVLLLAVGFVVFFLLTFLIGLSAFWYYRTFHLEFMFNHIVNFFSGVLVPLWFFPRQLRAVADCLPFDLVYFWPLSVLLGKTGVAELGPILLKGLAWIAILSIASACVWQIGKRKLVVQGG